MAAWTDGPADCAQRNACRFLSQRPDVGAGRAFAEFERAIDDAKVGINLQRARLHAQRPRLQGRPRMPVDDMYAHAPPNQLVRKHEAGRAGADDEDVSVHMDYLCDMPSPAPLTGPPLPPSLRRLRLPIPVHIARPVRLALLRLHLVRLFVIADDLFQGTGCDCRTFRAADYQRDWA